ncbi:MULTISPECIES: DivIVA domain-containing protein [unclassified Pseudactinotalea]|uniref:DivIVA domain-containing protein n=1 Tax=unclassified Pseudactinotalea TaxID=2649176 RepID=UPI00128DEDE8|nr:MULTISPECIES: DivIVA domain-containing protein [unclassified Pseudactinotalea]
MSLLTADDVLNKKFQPTKFREGYDQDEVDDFLDEVVNTLRAVYAENEELKARLAAGGAEAPAESAAQPSWQSPVQSASAGEPAGSTPSPEESSPPEQPEAIVSSAPVSAASVASAPAPVSAPAEAANEPESATGMLQLAQRLHDEYVSNGKTEADRLINEARTESERMVGEAEEVRNRTMSQLETERNVLEHKIDELRGFERDYRARLKSYLEGLLSDVEGRGPGTSSLGQTSQTGQNDLRRY